MPTVGFERAISACERPQTYALDRAAIGTGRVNTSSKFKLVIADVTQGIGETREAAAAMPAELASSKSVAQNCRTMTTALRTYRLISALKTCCFL